MDLPVRHILLRDAEWSGESRGLERAPDGALALRRVPAPAPGEALLRDGPYDAEPSGIAALDDLHAFVADAQDGRLLVSQRQCDATFSREFGGTPAGMAVRARILYVADRAAGCVRRFDAGALDELLPIGAGRLVDPIAVAVDSQERVYVLDRGVQRVLRFAANGALDAGYAPAVTSPMGVAITERDELAVSDAGGEVIRTFDAAGAASALIAAAAGESALRPRALAARGDLLLAANAADGSVLVFDRARRLRLGAIVDLRAPVAAMDFDPAGNLLLKLDTGPGYLRFAADAGRLAHGAIEAGPFDAGENNDWERATLLLSSGGTAQLSTFTAATKSAAVVWQSAPGLDCLVAPAPGRAGAHAGTRRYLWLRAELSGTGRDSAVLEQVGAETQGMSYLDELPRIYRRDDQATRFLERWLALFRARLDDRERRLEEAARDFDPAGAPAAHLARAAHAIAFSLPPEAHPDTARALLARAPDLYARRGTLAGVADMVELYSGIRPHIFEDFRARSVWQLGSTSSLGIHTRLAAATPEGFVVPRDARTDPAYAGLRGEYHAGVQFNEPVRQRTDAQLDFSDLEVRDRDRPTSAQPAPLLQRCSVRWEGQIRPRYSETYLLTFRCHGGLRCWMDGRPLVDEWQLASPERSLEARVVLDAQRWHSLRIEFASLQAPRPFRFSWSSRNQRPQAVPRECLYSILDDHADLTAPPPATFDVGHAVVGESGPLAASGFGEGLFGDFAHLFTVVAPAGSCRDAAARAALRECIDAEKPAHTDYHLCFVEPRMRVGFQARLGIDTIVASGPPPLQLDGTRLDRDSFLADPPPGTRVAARARLGQDTIVR